MHLARKTYPFNLLSVTREIEIGGGFQMLQDFDICLVRHTSLIHDLYINLRAIDALEVNIANQNFPNYGKNDFVRDICSGDYENHIVN